MRYQQKKRCSNDVQKVRHDIHGYHKANRMLFTTYVKHGEFREFLYWIETTKHMASTI